VEAVDNFYINNPRKPGPHELYKDLENYIKEIENAVRETLKAYRAIIWSYNSEYLSSTPHAVALHRSNGGPKYVELRTAMRKVM